MLHEHEHTMWAGFSAPLWAVKLSFCDLGFCCSWCGQPDNSHRSRVFVHGHSVLLLPLPSLLCCSFCCCCHQSLWPSDWIILPDFSPWEHFKCPSLSGMLIFLDWSEVKLTLFRTACHPLWWKRRMRRKKELMKKRRVKQAQMSKFFYFNISK